MQHDILYKALLQCKIKIIECFNTLWTYCETLITKVNNHLSTVWAHTIYGTTQIHLPITPNQQGVTCFQHHISFITISLAVSLLMFQFDSPNLLQDIKYFHLPVGYLPLCNSYTTVAVFKTWQLSLLSR